MSSLRTSGNGYVDPASAGPTNELLLNWMSQARSGDRAAFGRVVSALQDRLYNAVLRLVGHPDDALDVTQETFAKAYEKILEFRGDAQPYTWLFRIAMNLAVSGHRKAVVRRAVSIDAERPGRQPDDQMSSLRERLQSGAPTPDQRAEHRERMQLVRQALADVGPDDRALLVMRDIDGLDYNEMADVLGIPLGTLKSRLFRARLALRERIERLDR
jgi:RNA polymerase sigma-70 factor, ECF subfamily